jgi:hypothetical protein
MAFHTNKNTCQPECKKSPKRFIVETLSSFHSSIPPSIHPSIPPRFDVVTLSLFGMAFLCWSWAEIEVLRDGNRYLPRHMWRSHDPTLLAESLYAWATVCAFLKLLYFMQIDNNLGPLQVRVKRAFFLPASIQGEQNCHGFQKIA